ncbi:MAG TPA: purine-nucleoside phosphorylase [Candidatus Blautia faecigallinarum]|uniref:Purine nucleoside phosphorylase DeoD-type n=1 Tax=Candidatus Blautia faecigallinarum TaxID=2838488 RepID=A0A9D2DQY7_9FIRM|nr:purine-nucleoside phosphorylase [Candidatus Blautia faecigallinarum]
MSIPTPHNTAKLGDIAKKVLLPGDPLRAKYIAETYLEDPVCFNTVRNMFGFTGKYKGEPVSVMGSGMGMPSMGIYSYELFNFYDVDKIIRIGSAGALQDDINVMDIVIAIGACTDSNYASNYCLPGTFAPTASYDLLSKAVEVAKEQGTPVHVGNVVSSDVFYSDDPKKQDGWKKMGVLCAEMECAALYMNAARAGKQALGILTISDHIYREEAISAEARQTSFNKMMEIALGI